jgi:RNA recognition motif. (a.k.a. RRM, RBD, or RNP domain)
LEVKLPKDDRSDNGKLRGYGYVEFEERSDLKAALAMTDTVRISRLICESPSNSCDNLQNLKSRRIRIDVSENDGRRGGMSRGRDYGDRPMTDWRSGPRDEPPSRGGGGGRDFGGGGEEGEEETETLDAPIRPPGRGSATAVALPRSAHSTEVATVVDQNVRSTAAGPRGRTTEEVIEAVLEVTEIEDLEVTETGDLEGTETEDSAETAIEDLTGALTETEDQTVAVSAVETLETIVTKAVIEEEVDLEEKKVEVEVTTGEKKEVVEEKEQVIKQNIVLMLATIIFFHNMVPAPVSFQRELTLTFCSLSLFGRRNKGDNKG